MVLTRLGQYIMDVKMNTPLKDGGWVNSRPGHNHLLPLVLTYESEARDTALVVAISPLARTLTDDGFLGGGGGGAAELERLYLDPRFQHKLRSNTLFRPLFAEAAKMSHSPIRFVNFDTNAVEVARRDLDVFVGSFDMWLTQLNRQAQGGRA